VLSQTPDQYQKRFAVYLKNKLKPEDLPSHFDEVRDKISRSFQKSP
jgi:large subunit ribosomal protein L18